jgi:putative endonuclease
VALGTSLQRAQGDDGGMATDPRRQRGTTGEQVAAELLTGLGHTILARNFRTRYGELDIVAVDGDCLVFCEVRARRGRNAIPAALESIGAVKQAQLRRMAHEWFRLAGPDRPRTRRVRFDAVAVALAPGGRPVGVRHIPDAF